MSLVSEASALLEKERLKPRGYLQLVSRSWRSARRYIQERRVIDRGCIEELEAALEDIASLFGATTARRRGQLHLRVDFPTSCASTWYHIRVERGESHEGRTAAGRP